jgi:hypothetical protein
MVSRKLILSFTVFTFIAYSTAGQINEKPDRKLVNDSLVNEENTYAFVEKMPEFVGGKDSLKAYLKRAVGKLELNSKNKLKGRVYVSFIVTRSGDVSSMPSWKPGKQNGETMNVILHLPIDF